MIKPPIAMAAAALLVASSAGVRQATGSAAAAPSVCGPATLAGPFADPPDVAMDEQPANSEGEHELILAAHRDKDRFCFHYHAGGAERVGAPTIRVHAGERFALRVVNDISGPAKGESVASSALPACAPAMAKPGSGAAAYVGYLNHPVEDRWMPKLALDTNIHLHGFEGPAAQENVFLSTLSTPMHACEYHITIPATQPPGTYIYHPHVHGGSSAQLAGGLGGVWIVEPPAREIARSAEHVVVLRYRLPFKDDNAFAPANAAIYVAAMTHAAARPPARPVKYDPFAPPPWPLPFPIRAGGIELDRSGCDGFMPDAVLTVNGLDVPAALDVPGGEEQLFRLVNATSDSAKLLRLTDANGAELPFRVVELDGVPVGRDAARPLARYMTTKQLMLLPAARASILLSVPAGETVTLGTAHFCEGSLAAFQLPQQLLRIAGSASRSTGGAPAIAALPVRHDHTEAAQLVAYARAHPAAVRRRAITFSQYVFPKRGKIPPHASYFITDTTRADFREHAYAPAYRAGETVPARADIVVKAGSLEEWSLFNTTMESHTFHIHQMRFVALKGPDGSPATVDSTFVPVGTLLPNAREPDYPLVKPSVTTVLLDFRHVPRGTFVFHCHMLFHEDRGMMGILRVE